MMFETQIAVLSDIHGNRWALEAVLEDIQRRGIRRIVNSGDCVYGPLDPGGTAQILMDMNIPTVRGNEDRIIIEPSPTPDRSPSLRYVKECLSPQHIQWLKILKMTGIAYDQFFLVHGTPESDTEYLLHEVLEKGAALRMSNQLMQMLSHIGQPIILCGHDHIPRTVCLPDGKLIVNPGSVGLPAYADDLPYPHVMETGTPYARYSILTKENQGWRIEDVAIPYDWEHAAKTAMENGRPDWALWLRTGRARS